MRPAFLQGFLQVQSELKFLEPVDNGERNLLVKNMLVTSVQFLLMIVA